MKFIKITWKHDKTDLLTYNKNCNLTKTDVNIKKNTKLWMTNGIKKLSVQNVFKT